MVIEIIAHTMEYYGLTISSKLKLDNYMHSDYSEYKRIYEECFFEMRTALGLVPVNCCDSKEELLRKSKKIFVLKAEDTLIGSVAIYDNEIDDLIVAKELQRKGYGEALLRFAISHMQKNAISPICLHVADWNQGAIEMYLKNGFRIIKTETIR